ncbi:PEPxxWA-CTERM sorting domain-containing protein [Sphingorhabdus sp. Alg231-15]|uniref:PEPxxWA-CTERM sorting domain-containing protein n=1 Tax=Sphingorhabdus sp. Alg231-15 TaxID=1922222 RepID=UPI00307C431B
MKFKKTILATAAAIAAFSAGSAQAATLVLDAGWTNFNFGDTGSAITPDFDFVLTGPGYFNVTDVDGIGDVFQFTINGVVQPLTSAPVLGGPTTADPDIAFAGGFYTRASYLLGAGSYTVTGIVTDSPFGFGGLGGFAELSSTAPVPEPATWAFMILGFGAIGGALRSNRRRQRKAKVKVSYA